MRKLVGIGLVVVALALAWVVWAQEKLMKPQMTYAANGVWTAIMVPDAEPYKVTGVCLVEESGTTKVRVSNASAPYGGVNYFTIPEGSSLSWNSNLGSGSTVCYVQPTADSGVTVQAFFETERK